MPIHYQDGSDWCMQVSLGAQSECVFMWYGLRGLAARFSSAMAYLERCLCGRKSLPGGTAKTQIWLIVAATGKTKEDGQHKNGEITTCGMDSMLMIIESLRLFSDFWHHHALEVGSINIFLQCIVGLQNSRQLWSIWAFGQTRSIRPPPPPNRNSVRQPNIEWYLLCSIAGYNIDRQMGRFTKLITKLDFKIRDNKSRSSIRIVRKYDIIDDVSPKCSHKSAAFNICHYSYIVI